MHSWIIIFASVLQFICQGYSTELPSFCCSFCLPFPRAFTTARQSRFAPTETTRDLFLRFPVTAGAILKIDNERGLAVVAGAAILPLLYGIHGDRVCPLLHRERRGVAYITAVPRAMHPVGENRGREG